MSETYTLSESECPHCGCVYELVVTKEPGWSGKEDYNCPSCGSRLGSETASDIYVKKVVP